MDETYGTYVDDESFDIHDYDAAEPDNDDDDTDDTLIVILIHMMSMMVTHVKPSQVKSY